MKTTCNLVHLLCISLCILFRFGYCVTADGTIQSNEYGSNSKLTKSLNSEWYVYSNSTFLCVGVQMTGLQHVLVGLTFNPSQVLDDQRNINSTITHSKATTATQGWSGYSSTVVFEVAATHFVWCQSGYACNITGKTGYTIPGYIASNRNGSVVEFCMGLAGMSLLSRVVYFQGKVINDYSTTLAKSPDSYFYGFYMDDNVPAGLDANWYSFPSITTTGGDWNVAGWVPSAPSAPQNDTNIAASHAILLDDVTVNNAIQVSHLTQLKGASLNLATSGFSIGDYLGTSYWSYGNSASLTASSSIGIELWTPIALHSFPGSALRLPQVKITQGNNEPFMVPDGYSAEAVTFLVPANVTQSPSDLKTLNYSGSHYYTIGKEYPPNNISPLTLVVENGATVYANTPASYRSNISTIIVQGNSHFLYGYVGTNINTLPSLFISEKLQMTSDSSFTISAYLYVTSLDSENVVCNINQYELVHVQNDTLQETWPFLLFDETEFDVDVLEISDDTIVTLLNAGNLYNITWESSATTEQLCDQAKCQIHAENATITVTAIGLRSNCKTSKSFTVIAKANSKSQKKDSNQIILPVVVAIAGAVLIGAIVAFVVIKRRRSQNKSKQDVELSLKQPTEESMIMTISGPPKNHDSQPLIDPKYEIPFKEITFGPELGRGAFGIVYKCRWRNTDTVVKQMDINKSDKSSIDLFLKEAANVLKLRTHPNVCTVFGVCTDPLYPICILMEYLPDGSLDNLIYENKIKLDVKIVLELARDIASGMGHLHAENVLHCDLACRNLLVTTVKDKHVVKIADFGLSRITEKDTYNASNSATFPIRWTAPETLRSGKISRASDVWSYGVVLWEIIEGKRPYPELSNTEVTKAVCDKGYRLPRPDRIEIPNELWHLMQECWTEAPTERPSFDSIYKQLESIGSEYWGTKEPVIKHEVVQETVYNDRVNDTQYAETSGAVYGNQTT